MGGWLAGSLVGWFACLVGWLARVRIQMDINMCVHVFV